MANFTDFQSVFDLSSDAETDFDCTIGMEEDDMLIAAVEGFQEATIPDVNMKDFEDLHDTDDVKATIKDMESELGPGHDSKGSFAPTIDSTKTQEIIGDDVMDVLDLACPQFGVADGVQKGEGPDPEHINKEIDAKSDPMENSDEKHEKSSSPKAESVTDFDSALDELLREAEEEAKGDPSTHEDAAETKANQNAAGGCGVKKEEVADVDSLEDADDYSGYDDEDFEESSDIDDSVDVDSLEVDTDSVIEDEKEEEVHKDFGDPAVDPTHGKEVEGDEGPAIDATKESVSIFDLLDECDFPGCKSEDNNPVSSEMDDDVHKDFGEPSVDPTHKKDVEGDEGPVIDEDASVDSLEEEVEGDIGLRDLDMGMDNLEMGDDPDDNDQEQLQDEEDIDDVGLDEAFMEIMREADEILKDEEDSEDEEKGAGGCKKESVSVDSLEEEGDADSDDAPKDEAIDDESIDAADDAGDMSDDEVSSLEGIEDDDILDDILGQ